MGGQPAASCDAATSRSSVCAAAPSSIARRPVDPVGERVDLAADDEAGSGVEHDDVAVGPRRPRAPRAPRRRSRPVAARQVGGVGRCETESRGRPRTVRSRRRSSSSTVDAPVVRQLVEAVAVHDPRLTRRGAAASRPSARRTSGSATPISCRCTRPGLAIGPSRLNTVGMPISRRDGPANRNAGWKLGRSRTRCPRLDAVLDTLRRELDRDPELLEHVGGAALRRGDRLPVFAHRHPAPAVTIAAIVDTLIECESSPPVPTMSTRWPAARRSAARSPPAASAASSSPTVPRPSRPWRAVPRRTRSAGRRSPRRRGSSTSPRRPGRRTGRSGEQLGQQRGPTAVSSSR